MSKRRINLFDLNGPEKTSGMRAQLDANLMNVLSSLRTQLREMSGTVIADVEKAVACGNRNDPHGAAITLAEAVLQSHRSLKSSNDSVEKLQSHLSGSSESIENLRSHIKQLEAQVSKLKTDYDDLRFRRSESDKAQAEEQAKLLATISSSGWSLKHHGRLVAATHMFDAEQALERSSYRGAIWSLLECVASLYAGHDMCRCVDADGIKHDGWARCRSCGKAVTGNVAAKSKVPDAVPDAPKTWWGVDSKDTTDFNGMVAYWAQIMRLQDWDIHADYWRKRDMENDSAGAEIKYYLDKKIGILRALDPVDYNEDKYEPRNVELDVIHEMLHLHIVPFYEDNHNPLMEQAVHAISSALYKLDVARREADERGTS